MNRVYTEELTSWNAIFFEWQVKHNPRQEVLYSAANDPQTANDPQIGPQMIPNRKWSPMWTANDPAGKQRMAWILVSWIFLKFFFLFFFFSSTKR